MWLCYSAGFIYPSSGVVVPASLVQPDWLGSGGNLYSLRFYCETFVQCFAQAGACQDPVDLALTMG